MTNKGQTTHPKSTIDHSDDGEADYDGSKSELDGDTPYGEDEDGALRRGARKRVGDRVSYIIPRAMVRRVDPENTIPRKEVEEPNWGEGKDKRKWNEKRATVDAWRGSISNG